MCSSRRKKAPARRYRMSKPRQRGGTNFAQELLLREEMDRVGLSLATHAFEKTPSWRGSETCPKRSMQSSWALVAQGLSA